MKEGLIPQEGMSRYILGELSEAEQQQIEEVYFTDPAFLQDLLATRNDMIDAFVEGRMNVAEQRRFENRFQSSPALVEKVEFARAMFQAFDSEVTRGQATSIPDEKQSTLTDPLIVQRSPFRLSQWIPPQWGLVTASVLIVAGIFWFAALRKENQVAPHSVDQVASASPQTTQDSGSGLIEEPGKMQTTAEPSPTQKQGVVADHSKSLGATTRAGRSTKFAASIASFLLIAGGSRANDDLRKLVIPAQVGTVRLQLEIEEPGVRRYQAVLQTQQGEKIWVKDNLPLLRLRSGRVVVCDLPKALLENKDYVLHLRSQATRDANDFVYYFQIAKL